MTPAARLALADDMCRNHTAGCGRCGPPAVERPTAGCHVGRRLEAAWLTAWRRRIDALSGGWRP